MGFGTGVVVVVVLGKSAAKAGAAAAEPSRKVVKERRDKWFMSGLAFSTI
jgi:hypothetical protein